MKKLGCGFLVLVVLVVLGILPAFPLEFIFAMLFGWFSFLRQTLPAVQVSQTDIAVGIGATCVFYMVLHQVLMSFAKRSADDGAEKSAWPFRRTFAIASIVLIAFTAGISIVGITHQCVWLSTTNEPLFNAGVRQAAYRNQSMNNIKQITFATADRADPRTNRELPSGRLTDDRGKTLHGWLLQLLPFLEQYELYKKIDRKTVWYQPPNAEFFRVPLYAFQNPGIREEELLTVDGFATSHYAANQHVIGPHPRLSTKAVTDGTSAGEVNSRVKPWGSTSNWRDPALGLNANPDGFGAPWTGGGVNMTFVDGSARFISNDIDPRVLKALATPAGGESVNPPD